MAVDRSPEDQRRLGRVISIVIILSAAITGLLAVRQVTANPRTDDAEVFANYIGMAPLVNGPITRLYVSDNQLVKEGDPLLRLTTVPMPMHLPTPNQINRHSKARSAMSGASLQGR